MQLSSCPNGFLLLALIVSRSLCPSHTPSNLLQFAAIFNGMKQNERLLWRDLLSRFIFRYFIRVPNCHDPLFLCKNENEKRFTPVCV